jgi:hypothetical protein
MEIMDFLLPPPFYMMSVLNHCPTAGALYVKLWNRRDEENVVIAPKKDIDIEYGIQFSKFSHDLLMLLNEGLLSFFVTTSGKERTYHIELVGWQEEEFY